MHASCRRRAEASSGQATVVAAGCALGDLAGEVRAGDDGHPLRRDAAVLGDDLAHPAHGAELDALHQGHDHRVGLHQLAPGLQVHRQRLGGDRQDHQGGAREGLRRVAGGAHLLREGDAGVEHLVGVRGVDRLLDLGLAGPHHDITAGVAQDHAEPGPPGPCTHHRYAGHQLSSLV